MLRAGVGQAEGVDTVYLTRKALARARADLGRNKPRAALVFAGAEFDHAAMLGEIRRRYPDIALAGCTTAGEMSSNMGLSESSIIVMLFASDSLEIRAGLGENASDDPRTAAAAALKTAREGLVKGESFCLAFPDGTSRASAEVLDALNAGLSGDCPLFGGAAARHGALGGRPKQFFEDRVVEDAVVLLLFAGPLRYSFAVSNSWEPVGRRETVTGARGRVVRRIGERRALDFYRHHLGEHARPAGEFPLAVFDGDGERFYLRVPVGYEEGEGTVTFGAPVPQGAVVQLTVARRARVLDEARRSVEDACRAFEGAPEAALVFSCNARKGILGTRMDAELDLLREQLPPHTPIAGFYGFAEFSPLVLEGASKLHHSTMVTLLIGGTPGKGTPHKPPAPAGKEPHAVDPVESLRKERDFLRRRLRVSEYYRKKLESGRDADALPLRELNLKIIASRDALTQEKHKRDELLRDILPEVVAEELEEKGAVEPVFFPTAAVLFADFADFSRIVGEMNPKALVRELDFYFAGFDKIADRHGLEKLKAIGGAYMCVGGVPSPSPGHILRTVRAAWDLRAFMADLKKERTAKGEPYWELRIGVHAGPLMAGVIGRPRFAYDVWGDTVNIASHLGSTCETGEINVSLEVYEAVHAEFDCVPRGTTERKNKGGLEMFRVRRKER